MGWVTYASDQLRADHIGCFEIAQLGLRFETRDERSYALTVTLLSIYLSMNNLDGYGFDKLQEVGPTSSIEDFRPDKVE